jgi:hypothetical protein
MHFLRGTFSSIAAAALAAACSAASSSPSAPVIRLDTSSPEQPVVEVTGLSARDRAALAKADLTSGEWPEVFRVSVRRLDGASGELPPVAGRYSIGQAVRFVPSFPLDPGREYEVVFDPAKLSRAPALTISTSRALVSLPREAQAPSTIVTAVYPSGDVIPENQLRMYVQFSAPMGQGSGREHLAILDQDGRELVDAMLPLDTELWNPERTRYTVLFDPGRVKRKILPNREMGRALRRGETITLVVSKEWLDGRGQPLISAYRSNFRVGPAIERPLDAAEWRIAAAPVDTREPLRITFPAALDRALLERGLSVERAGGILRGEWRIEAGETRSLFVPDEPWQPGEHVILVLPILEDGSGNRIGRAFEVLSPGEAVPAESSQPTSLPFRIAAKR